MTERPTFIMTNGQRNTIEDSLDVGDLKERYRRIAQSIYKWEGSPEGVPEGWQERALFDFGGISGKDTPFGNALFAVAPVRVDWYGIPTAWLPTGVRGIEQIKSLYKESENPVLWTGTPLADLIDPYIRIMEQVLKVLSQNIIGLSQPVIVEGMPGNELDGQMVSLDLKTGKSFLPIVKKNAMPLNVLDLKAQDHTQNLYSTYQSMHDTIMSLMGLMNGNNKTSGVNPVEQIADTQEIRLNVQRGLEIRRAWADKINAVLGTSMNVRIADAWEVEDQANDNAGQEDTYQSGQERADDGQ